MDRPVAGAVLVLGTLVLIGGLVGIINGMQDDDPTALLPLLLVVLAMRRARSGRGGHTRSR